MIKVECSNVPPWCLAGRLGTPPRVGLGYARPGVDRLPAGPAAGSPPDETARLQELITPVAAGRSTLDLRPCPDR